MWRVREVVSGHTRPVARNPVTRVRALPNPGRKLSVPELGSKKMFVVNYEDCFS